MLRNATLVAPLVAWTIAQVLKFVIDGISKGRADFRRLVNPGGMPSSHSTLVSCMSVMIGRIYSWDSPLFAMAAVLSLIVLYDAAGIRRAAGKQAQVINRIVEDIYKKRKVPEQRLKELLGHTPLEVFAGVALGVLVASYWPIG
ncbi:MAG: divergent PAP2 family protein [Bacillota bacterium]|jgi:acid phosphatase family membrane protein YuiD|nr:divergent PAP2 family protein [Bacillota bacterium]HOJ58095.1 divergent PAP2 family protein [Bacillota bacterium]HPO80816.1 divergent PAP2 family protein [Bacillota bacterium]